METKEDYVIGVPLSETLKAIALEAAIEICKEKGGVMRAAMAYELSREINICVIETDMLAGDLKLLATHERVRKFDEAMDLLRTITENASAAGCMYCRLTEPPSVEAARHDEACPIIRAEKLLGGVA